MPIRVTQRVTYTLLSIGLSMALISGTQTPDERTAYTADLTQGGPGAITKCRGGAGLRRRAGTSSDPGPSDGAWNILPHPPPLPRP